MCLHIGDQFSQHGSAAGTADHLWMQLQDKELVAFQCQCVKFLFPVAEHFPVRVHGTDCRVTEGEIIIGKIVHGDITGEFYERKHLSVNLPEIWPVTVFHGRAV